MSGIESLDFCSYFVQSGLQHLVNLFHVGVFSFGEEGEGARINTACRSERIP